MFIYWEAIYNVTLDYNYKRFDVITIRKDDQGCECLCTAYNKYPAVIEIFASSRKCVVNKSIIDITYYIDIASKYDK